MADILLDKLPLTWAGRPIDWDFRPMVWFNGQYLRLPEDEKGLPELARETMRRFYRVAVPPEEEVDAFKALVEFYTAGPQEVRAWTITRGTKAPQAAGKIHTDFEKGFIRAEVVSFDDFMACGGSMAAAKEKGVVRLEGKDYVMQDGDIVLFRFNV